MTVADIDYIRSLELPAARSRGPGGDAKPPTFTADPQAVVVGGQITEFAAAVDPVLRGDLTNCLLLAQLAADKAVGNPAPDPQSWQRVFTEVLRKTGWVVADGEFQEQAMSTTGAFVHKAIIPVITAFLGPTASAASLVLKVLNGLQAMDENKPWITLFQAESQTVNGAKVQVNLVDKAANGDAAVSLLTVGIAASKGVTQVLFFKVSGEATRLTTATGQLTIAPATLATIRDAVGAKVRPHLVDNVAMIDI